MNTSFKDEKGYVVKILHFSWIMGVLLIKKAKKVLKRVMTYKISPKNILLSLVHFSLSLGFLSSSY